MKKIVLILLVAFTLGLVMASCSSNKASSCPAYGEYQQYQRENVY